MAEKRDMTSRSHPRLQVTRDDGATLICEQGATRLDLYDVSMAGLAFVVPAGRRPGWLEVGEAIGRVVVQIGDAAIHAEIVPTHVTPIAGGALLVGARVYPATEFDHDALTTAVVRLERGFATRAQTA